MAKTELTTPKVIDFKLLKEKMVYKWRVQSSKEFGTTLVAYVDARDVEDVLDKIVSPENWQCEYTEAVNQMICRIGIFCNGQWVWKSDGGSESQIEKEKGLLSDSFKRAAVKWGIGRFLYRLKPFKLPSIKGYKDKFYPAHDIKKYGPVEDVPFGILKYDFQEKRVGLQINDVDKYIWQFLEPWSAKQKKNNN